MAVDDSEYGSALRDLTDAVKSKILERIVADLREGLKLGSRASGYTRSDSGIYGKHQKADIDLADVLAAVKTQLDTLLAQYEGSAAEPAQSDEPKSAP
jgi:hypothetical protein